MPSPIRFLNLLLAVNAVATFNLAAASVDAENVVLSERHGLAEPLKLDRTYSHRNTAQGSPQQSHPELAKRSASWPARAGNNDQSSRFPLLADPALSASGSLGLSAFGFPGFAGWTGSARVGLTPASVNGADYKDSNDAENDSDAEGEDDEESSPYKKRDLGTVIAAAAPQAPPPSIALTTGGQPVVVPAPGVTAKSFTNSSHSSSTRAGSPAASGAGAARAPALELVPSHITKLTTIVSTITSDTLVPVYSAARAPEPVPFGAGIPLNLSPQANHGAPKATITIAEVGNGHSISLVAAPSGSSPARAPAVVAPVPVPAPAPPKASPYVPPAVAPAAASPKAIAPAAAVPAAANASPKPAVIPAAVPVVPKPVAPVLNNGTHAPFTNGTKPNPANAKPGSSTAKKSSTTTAAAPKASNGGNTRAMPLPGVAAQPAVPDCNCACRCPAGSYLMGNVNVGSMQAKPSSSSVAAQGAVKPKVTTFATRASSSSSSASSASKPYSSVKAASHSGNVRAGMSTHSTTTTASSSKSSSSSASSRSSSSSTSSAPASPSTHIDMASAEVVSTVMASHLLASMSAAAAAATTTTAPNLTVGGSVVSLQSAVFESLVGGKVVASAVLKAEG